MANTCKEKALLFGIVSVPTMLVGNTEHGQLFALTLKMVKTFFLVTSGVNMLPVVSVSRFSDAT